MRCYDNYVERMSSKILAVVILVVVGSSTVVYCQEAITVRPIRHSLRLLESVNGSSSDGGCTSRDRSICNLQDGGTSVLFDSTILPLNGPPNGVEWARGLFTLERPLGGGLVSVGFDFGTAVQVRRVELVLFNCEEWSIRAIDIEVYAEPFPMNFPRTDPTDLNRATTRLRQTGDNSCEDLYKICVSLPVQTQVYYIVFPNAAGSDWVHLAEATFYNDSASCTNRDTSITEPVTPPPETTNEVPSTIASDATATTTMMAISSTSTDSASSESNSTPGIVAAVVVIVFLVLIALIAVVIIVMYILMKKRKKNMKEVENLQTAIVESKGTVTTMSSVKSSEYDQPPDAHYDTVDPKYDTVATKEKTASPEPALTHYEDIDSQLKNGLKPPKPARNNSNKYNVLRENTKPKANTFPKSQDDPAHYSTLDQSDMYAVPGGEVYAEPKLQEEYSEIKQPGALGAVYAEPHVQEEYSEIQKPAAPVIPAKSSELVEYLETKPVPQRPPEQAEYSEIGDSDDPTSRTSTLTKLSAPFSGTTMNDNTLYVSTTVDPNNGVNGSVVPQPMADNIYAEPGEPSENPDNWQDIYETVYSEPIKPSHFKEGESEAVSKEEELFPYSSIYTVPVLPDEEDKALVVRKENIKEMKVLGRGNFGQVVLAETVGLSRKQLRLSTGDESSVSQGSIKVAVKKLKASASMKTRELFDKECKFMSRLRHPNVIRLLGVCTEDTPFIMMEYMENGDLNQYLKRFDSISDDYYQNTNAMSPGTLTYMATQIASAMQYLASQNFVHRDLATRNCLVGQNNLVKIADFGMSRSLYDSHYYIIKGKAILPIRWMATECFYGKFSAKTDVWAFGVTVWEIFTLAKEEPYDGTPDSEVVEDAVRGENRTILERPAACPEEVYRIMKMCWFFDPAKRATFDKLYSMLSSIAPK